MISVTLISPSSFKSAKTDCSSSGIETPKIKLITSKNQSPSLHWIPITKTGKARAAIRRYWHERGEKKQERTKKYNTTLWISLPDKPGQLGNISSLIGNHNPV